MSPVAPPGSRNHFLQPDGRPPSTESIRSMKSLPYRRSLRAAVISCAALLSACTPSARAGTGGPAPDLPAGPAPAWTRESPADEISRWVRRECGSPFRNKQACVERNLVALIDQAGIKRTMEVLDTLVNVDGDVRYNAHALAHGLGIAAYRTPETMAATFAGCPPSQMSGCYHGVVQGYFLSLARQGRLPGTPELDTMCEPHRASTFLYFQCAHGMGHGLMAVHENHVPMSLEACDLATDEFIRHSCYGGVFMENVVHVTHPHHTAEGHAGTQGHDAQPAAGDGHAAHGGSQPAAAHDHGAQQADAHAGHGGQQAQATDAHAGHGGARMQHGEWTPLNRADPLYPCNAVAEKYQEPCYAMQTSPILFYNGGDVAATARACDQAPPQMVPVCLGSLGRDVMAMASLDHARGLELCGRAREAAGGQGETLCIVGLAQNLVNLAADPDEGIRLCRAAAADHKRACYLVVGEMIRILVAAPAREQSCRAAEPEYVPACRSGAGVESTVRTDDE